jgi:hypothetical protein
LHGTRLSQRRTVDRCAGRVGGSLRSAMHVRSSSWQS